MEYANKYDLKSYDHAFMKIFNTFGFKKYHLFKYHKKKVFLARFFSQDLSQKYNGTPCP